MSEYLESLKKRLTGVPDSTPAKPRDIVHPPAATKPTEAKPEKKETKPKLLIIHDKEKHFFLSQSLIKAITTAQGDYNETCARNIYERFVTRNYFLRSPYMQHGLYGETQILGSAAKGQKIVDLPKHKITGKKLTAQRNIDEQTHRMKIWQNERSISIIPGVNTQIPITKRYDKKILVSTEFDIFPSPFLHNDKLHLTIIDIKFTNDVNNHFGPFCWGAPEFIDHIQADMAYWLVQDFDMELNIRFNPEKEQIYKSIFHNSMVNNVIKNEELLFIYFVIGYQKEPLDKQVLFLHRSYRDPMGELSRQLEWKERARKSIAQMSEWRALDWPAQECQLCVTCPVNKKNGGYCEVEPLKHI